MCTSDSFLGLTSSWRPILLPFFAEVHPLGRSEQYSTKNVASYLYEIGNYRPQVEFVQVWEILEKFEKNSPWLLCYPRQLRAILRMQLILCVSLRSLRPRLLSLGHWLNENHVAPATIAPDTPVAHMAPVICISHATSLAIGVTLP